MFGHIDILYMATLVGFQVFAHIYIYEPSLQNHSNGKELITLI